MKPVTTFILATSIFSSWLVLGCKKNPDVLAPPVLTTKPVTNISSTSAVSGGEIANATNITDMGIIWGTDSTNISISGFNRIRNGAGTSNFTDTIQNLQPNTTYYLKAYAVYGQGTIYGATIKFTTQPVQPAVYIAGYNDGSAVYWKNSTTTSLPTGANNGWGHSIFVVGNDVYTAGEYNATTRIVAVYWKNGTMVPLTNSSYSSVANSIFVAGNDIYAAGYELANSGLPVAKYWKNGVPVSLTDGTNINSGIAYSIVVADNDVYVAGFTSNQLMGRRYATYWKNGIAVPLSDSNNYISTAKAIYVQGNDVYVSGGEKPGVGIAGIPVAKYWKNGIPVALTDGTQFAEASSICVSEGNVYTAGYEYSGTTGYSVAKYWKNSTAFSLTDDTKYGTAYSIFVVGNDVHVAGGEGDYFDARYWKNGVNIPLSTGTGRSRASGIFVK